MKKQLTVFIIAFGLLLSACSSSKTQDSSEVDQLKQQITKLTEDNQKLKDELNQLKTTPEPSSQPLSSASSSQEVSAAPNNVIELNNKLTIQDFAEITLVKIKFTSKVVPPNPDGMYSYYEVKDPNNIYLEIVLNVKSLLTSAKGAEEFASVKVKYDDKYDYDSFSTIEESGGTNFTYTNITNIEPLKNGILHFIAELPKESSKDTKSVKIIVTLQGQDYTYKLR